MSAKPVPVVGSTEVAENVLLSDKHALKFKFTDYKLIRKKLTSQSLRCHGHDWSLTISKSSFSTTFELKSPGKKCFEAFVALRSGDSW